MIIRLTRVMAWLYAAGLVFLTLSSPDLRPGTPIPHNLEHLTAFWVAGLLFSIGYQSRLLFLFVAGTTSIAVLEGLQLFVPHRHARWIDLLTNASGFWTGLIFGLIVSRSVGYALARAAGARTPGVSGRPKL